MENVKLEVKGDKLLIEIDLKKRQGLSKSEKNEIIATTGGNADIRKDGIKLGLNCYVAVRKK